MDGNLAWSGRFSSGVVAWRHVAIPHPEPGQVLTESIDIIFYPTPGDIPADPQGLQPIWCGADTRKKLPVPIEAHFRPSHRLAGRDENVAGPWYRRSELMKSRERDRLLKEVCPFWLPTARTANARMQNCNCHERKAHPLH